MTQADHPARRSPSLGPKRRGDATRPPSTRSRASREGDRRPWPTASTTTRVSPAKPGSARVRTRSRGSAATPPPATVWPAGRTPIDLDATWPTPIVSTIVRAFSKSGARVVLLPWPSPQPISGARHRHGVVDADNAHDVQVTDGTEVADALTAVENLDRSGHVVHVAAEDNLTGPASRPFWADLVDDRTPLTASSPSSLRSPSGIDATKLDDPDAISRGGVDSSVDSADLIITSLRPAYSGNQSSDLVALVAARLLRVGGILAVLTHSDWLRGELIDPTGAVVASAQNADLLYLQHIVALHVPVRGGRFATELLTDADDSIGGTAAETQARAAHRAAVRGLPTPHRRIHSDLLVFAQPHEHHDHDEPLPDSPAEQALNSGIIR
jgi:hypothetical protein